MTIKLTDAEKTELINAKHQYRRECRNFFPGWTKRTASKKFQNLRNRLNIAI
jgi:hypothetical protein